MLWFIVLIAVASEFPGISSRYFPSYFPKCFIDDVNIDNCLLRASSLLQLYVKDGVEEIRLPSFNPVTMLQFIAKQDSHLSNYSAAFWNFTVHDMYRYKMNEISFDAHNLILRGKISFGKLPFSSIYRIKGDLVKIYLDGKGMMSGELGPIDGTFRFEGDLVKRGDIEYVNITDFSLKLFVHDLKLRFDNLFDGNEELGAKANGLLNENSKFVVVGTTPIIEVTMQQYVLRYAKWLTDHVPLNRIFPRST